MDTLLQRLALTAYELIAYLCSTGLLALSFGLIFVNPAVAAHVASEAPARTPWLWNIVVIFGFVSMIYVVSQSASVISHVLISKPVARIARMFPNLFPDFDIDFQCVFDCFGDNALVMPEGRPPNKWTIIYYLLERHPAVGADILRRYAREKLARINASNQLLLCLMSLVVSAFHWTSGYSESGDSLLKVPHWWAPIITACAGLFFVYEFIRRRSWNNDIICKAVPGVLARRQPPEDVDKEEAGELCG